MTVRRPGGQAEHHDDLRAFRATDQRFGESGDFRAEFRYRLVRPTLVAGVDWRGARRGRFGCGSHAHRDAGRKAGLVDGAPGFYRAALLVRGGICDACLVSTRETAALAASDEGLAGRRRHDTRRRFTAAA